MSNHITIELCAEDRARIDRLAAALEKRTCDKCVTAAVEYLKTATETAAPVNETVEAPKNATGQAETSTPTTTPTEEEKPKAEETSQPAPTKTATHADVKALYIKLAASGKREPARAIIIPISPSITGIPEEKVQEVYDKLAALEGGPDA